MITIVGLAAGALLGPPDLPEPSAPAVSVQWNAPPSCPDAATVEANLARLADVRFAPQSEAVLRIAAVVTATQDGFATDLHVWHADGEEHRHLVANDCELLGRGVAIVAAVALDPVTVAARVREQVEPAEPSPEPMVSEPLIVPPPEPERSEPSTTRLPPAIRTAPRRDRVVVEAGSRFGVGVGGLILPGVGVGFTAAPFVGVRRFHAQLALEYWVPRRRELEGTPGAGGSFQLATAGLRGCPIVAFGRWRLMPCAGVDVGALVGSGYGSRVAGETTATNVWTAVVVQLGLDVTLTRHVGLWAAFEGGISLNRPQYHLDNGGPLHRAGPFGPRGVLGVVVHAPRSIP